MQNNQEQERLKRLRDRQIADRDPLVKQRQFQRFTSRRIHETRKALTFKEAWKDLPKLWKGALYGLIAGVIALVIVPIFWQSAIALLCVAGGTLAAVVIGMAVGGTLDYRDELRHLTK